jgi:gliding motility-associated-like protein
LSAGDYPYQFTDRFGCTANEVLSLTSFPSFQIELIDTICQGQTYSVGGSVYGVSGIMVDTLTTLLGGCDSVVTLRLTVLDEPNVAPDFAVSNPGCPGAADGSVILMGVTGGFAPLSYSFNGVPGAVGSVVTGLSAGDYTYRFTDRFGCTAERVLSLEDPSPSQLEIVDTICVGQSFTVGSNEYTTSGITTDILTSSRGCDSIVTLRLTVVPDPMIMPDFAVTDPNCADGADGLVRLTGLTGGFAPVTYTLGGVPRGQDSIVTGLAEGDYPYVFTDRFGCTAEGVLTLTSPLPFDVELGPDQVIELGESIRLDDGTNDEVATYSYTPAGIVDCTTGCDGLLITPTENVTLSLLATSPLGCEARDSVRYVVLTPREVYLPNAFSPNGDGINDRFTLFGDTPSAAMIASLRIYDRWGGEVFFGENLPPNATAAGWDGKINEQLAASGLYHYTAEVVFLDGVVLPYRGSVMLLR